VQAGLGGGSSDAAATLRALQRIWRVDPECVSDAAVRLGADVPFFLEGGTVLGLGRGDVLFPLIDRPREWVVLVVPPFGVTTAEAYRWWDRGPKRPAPHVERPFQGRRQAVNDLQRVVVKRHPEISRLVRAFARAGAAGAAMSGSGSAVFGLFKTRADAERAADAVHRPRWRTFVTRTVTREEYHRPGLFAGTGLAAN